MNESPEEEHENEPREPRVADALRGSQRLEVRPGKWWIPVVVVAIGMWIAFQLRSVLTPFLLAFLLAYALDPVVSLLERARIPRPLGAIVVFGGLFSGAMFGAAGAIRTFGDEITDLSHTIPERLATLERLAAPWVYQQFHFRFPKDAHELFARYGDKLRQGAPAALGYVQTALFGTISYVFVILSLLIIPVFAFYLLIDFDRIVERGGKLVPRRWQRSVFDAMGEIHQMLGGYVRGQLLAMILLASLYSAGLEWTGVRLAIPIGVITGMLAFVPYIGFTTCLALATAMSLLDWRGPVFVAKVVIVMLSVQVIDGLLVTPRVVGRSVGLGPIEVLLAMAAAGSLFGFVGVLLAVPIGATVKIVLIRLTHAYKRSEFYRRTE